MNRMIAVLTVACLIAPTGTVAQTTLEEAQTRARELTASSRPALDRARAAPVDIPGVRESVRSLAVGLTRTCERGRPRYTFAPIASGDGPALLARAATLESSYLYPETNGLRLTLSGDGEGATLSIGPKKGPGRPLGTIAAEEGACRPYPAAVVRLDLADGASAALAVVPRPGIFRPACYKDPINGFYKLDIWKILMVIVSGEMMLVRTPDGASFPDELACRMYYARLPDGG